MATGNIGLLDIDVLFVDSWRMISLSSIFYLYIFIGSLIIFFLCKFVIPRHDTSPLSYFQLVGYYGYSLTLLFPAVILLLIPSNMFGWLIIIVEISISGLILGLNLQSYIKIDQSKLLMLWVVIIGLHCIAPVIVKTLYLGH
ncbi:hypothetical protein MXB_2233 [Myxobolus squamalis]|nr:hypothetical protein MXB_2233 [Myxobolus squamalis]